MSYVLCHWLMGRMGEMGEMGEMFGVVTTEVVSSPIYPYDDH
ncbi:hypothetical protein [Laspinema palackyanum]